MSDDADEPPDASCIAFANVDTGLRSTPVTVSCTASFTIGFLAPILIAYAVLVVRVTFAFDDDVPPVCPFALVLTVALEEPPSPSPPNRLHPDSASGDAARSPAKAHDVALRVIVFVPFLRVTIRYP